MPGKYGAYDVVWPRGKSQVSLAEISPRLSTLAGKKIAQLWDYVFRGDEIFTHLEGALKERFPGVEFINWRDFGHIHGTDERAIIKGLADKLKALGVDAVIAGVGACGSCTPAVVRASAVAERAGIPSVSLISEGFVRQAKSTVVGLGLPDLPVAMIPGHPGAYSHEQLRENSRGGILDQVVEGLTRQPVASKVSRAPEPDAKDVVFSGSFEDVNAHFYANEWSDGLPIVPPTREKVEEFLRFTDLDRNTVLGVVLPDNRAATVWNIAVNGVMAGCRPEYMPILVAIAEVLCDPSYGVEHSGNTPGADSLIILNGPITKQLKFNYEQGVMRDGFQPNTTVGRFLRLFLRNICGFLLHKTDKGCYGNTWRVVVPENEDFVAKIGWEPLSAEMGFKAGDNTVTIGRYTGGDVMISATGTKPEEIMPYLADGAGRMVSWQLCFTIGAAARGMLRPLLILPPVVAEVIAKHGWSKGDIKQYLFDHARIPAWRFEKYTKEWTEDTTYTLKELVRMGNAPKIFHESDDPNRMLPIVCEPDDFQVIVSGDPLRTNCYYFQHNGSVGYTTAKQIKLPRAWDSLLAGDRQVAAVA
ncbi:MAG: hypothetical protein QOE02_5563 [Rhodospirillaceae bacterium]|jgi:hypothetical protein|nr:hypothetical protein [Rhodospirillaceae bacterium]